MINPYIELDLWGRPRAAHDPLCDRKAHPNDEYQCYGCKRAKLVRADQTQVILERIRAAAQQHATLWNAGTLDIIIKAVEGDV